MREFLPDNLLKLADVCQQSLYMIGGSVRDFLLGVPLDQKTDYDLSSPMSEVELIEKAEGLGFQIVAVYKNTGTVKLKDLEGTSYEFTRFRSDKYVRGIHAPSEVIFTEDILLDARRRDFTSNAVYYDIKSGAFVDPLSGIGDIKQHILNTVAPAEKVFGEDGLRLMRLCRFAAQLGFTPSEECLAGAKKNADLIKDIHPERIFTELDLLLHADEKFSDPAAPYNGLRLLKETGVLSRIMGELAAGDKLYQREDFHSYDVLEHSFRCVLYSPPSIRYAALLHDVGKPFCFTRDGNFHAHPEEGAKIAGEILSRLKAPLKLIRDTQELILWHMRDFDCRMRNQKVLKTIRDVYPFFDDLLALKQADFSACKDDLSPAPTVEKWKKIYGEAREENIPFALAELDIRGGDLKELGIPAQRIGQILEELLNSAIERRVKNEKNALLRYAQKLSELPPMTKK